MNDRPSENRPTSGSLSRAPGTGVLPTVRSFTLGPFATNCYTVRVPDRRGCWIVDAGYDPDELIQNVRAAGLVPNAVVLTHAHPDHIAGLGQVLAAFPGTPVWIHHAEEAWLSDPDLNLSTLIGPPITGPAPDRLLCDGDRLDLEGSPWAVLHTPGHSPGGITLYNEASATALVGDTLFAGSVGRTDFPGGDPQTLARSIRQKLYTLPRNTTVYPGHGPPTTIGEEMASNPYVPA